MAAPVEALRAALADRYRIDRELGRGGMATVYLAEDLRHGRQVALKVLDPELAAVIGPDRFLREIQTSARLTHPHILPVHDSGTAAGLLYYVMPHVEGESLRARLDREHRLPIPDAIRLAAEVARALDYSHAKGVIHRDIKPGNVLLESGQAVLADFGIARVIEQSAGEHLTQTGVTMGTPLYMSPEQTTAVDVDGRSDLYSLGCVLYEMVAGRPPFTGATAGSVIHQHLIAAPRPVSELRPGVPEALDHVIARALSKSPADRFQTGASMAESLDAALTASLDGASGAHASSGVGAAADPSGSTFAMPRSEPGRRRLAAISAGTILLLAAGWLTWSREWPPQRLRPQLDPNKRAWILVADFDAPDSVLAAAVKDLVSTALDQSTTVRTVPPTGIKEALAAAGKPRSAHVDADLARELAYRRSVRAIVVGSITRAGHTYVVTARAEDVDSARVIATATEVAKDDNALIPAAARIGAALRRRLGEGADAVRATRRLDLIRTPSFEALQLYLTAERLGWVNGDHHAAIELERRATLLDPEFAVAWASLANYKGTGGDRDSAIVLFRRALQCASRLTDAERYFIEGKIAVYQEDVPRSVILLRQAVELGAQGARSSLAVAFAALGRLEEALAIFRELQHEEWSSGTSVSFYEWLTLLGLGRVEEAARLSASFPPPRSRYAPVLNALVGEQWNLADSLGLRLLADESEDPLSRWYGGNGVVGAESARGSQIRAGTVLDHVAAVVPEFPDYKMCSLYVGSLMDLLGGRSRSPARALASGDTNLSWRSYLAVGWAVAGDTARSRALIVRLRSAPPSWEARLMSVLATGLIDSRAARNERVVELLGPTARSGLFESRLPIAGAGYAIRWLVGTAWERLGRPDSAIVYYELALEPGRTADVNWLAHAVTLPYVLQRLVVVNARMGRIAEAEKRWKEFQSLVTAPDKEFQPLVAQARAEMSAARAREGVKGR